MSGSDGARSLRKSSTASRTPSSSPLPSLSLTRDHITEALSKSPDGGATLDLAYKGLTDVGESGVEELASVGTDEDGDDLMDSPVVRIALAHNRLTALPMAFSLLSRLRYLVLKNNNFSIFPDVLTVLPSLEILDISRNKLKSLPSQPGSLVNLRVFSLTRNKLQRLPPYLSKFKQLTLLKVDQNPLQWPNQSILEFKRNPSDPQAMADWIHHLQSWLEEHASEPGERKLSDDSMTSEISNESSFLDPLRGDRTPSLHAESILHSRSVSMDSEASSFLHTRSRSPGPPRGPVDEAPRLHLDHFFSHLSSAKSATPSPRSPEAVTSPIDDPPYSNGVHAGHARYASSNASVNGNGSTKVLLRSNPAVKKSMTDLRPTRLHGLSGIPRAATHGTDHFPIFHHHLPHNSITDEPVHASPISINQVAPSMDTERNSYFRRLSTLSAATLSKAIPDSLLAVVDAVRGILFALSQIYQSLQHYTVYAIDERLSAVLQKVLGPAAHYMSQLIHTLDRFDAVSRRALPSPPICRMVIECCRDNVTIFGKAAGMLSLQLKVLAKHDDERYTRQMLLVLYGAMSEIAAAWQSMSTHVDAIRPYLSDQRPPPSKSYGGKPRTNGIVTGDKPRTPSSAPPATSSPFLPGQPETPQRFHLRTNTQRSLDLGKIHISRRHAGSFSSKDVEIGKLLPSYIDPPPSLPSGFSSNGAFQQTTPTPSVRTMRRLVLPGQQQSQEIQLGGHSRHGSQTSLLSNSTSSPQLSGLSVSGTSTLVDKDLIGAMKAAVEAAPEIWDMMDEVLDVEASDADDDFRDMLARAKAVTERLRRSIAAVQEGGFSQVADGKALHDDAHLFVKTVIQLSRALKTRGTVPSATPAASIANGATSASTPTPPPLSSTLRTKMVRLTNATQEFVMLLHVSSFSPAPTPGLRSHSPMVGFMNGGLTPQPPLTPMPMSSPSFLDESRLGSNLSRARSANAVGMKV
ncbi:RAM signaling pathway protein-domain-containing protein [Epithele typhae]|uniref:RAM signaling pathway protein-domain-containing protein n=1 Tax=Epithele typhae TaxID=378194 RepID=UPI002008E706|nr:RAM signaling pathway protein-domain-containing protein [Epithele typhae]KAH9945938.1 RAM signaling pathway protein-domain-containing protein [Epithele typhae]